MATADRLADRPVSEDGAPTQRAAATLLEPLEAFGSHPLFNASHK